MATLRSGICLARWGALAAMLFVAVSSRAQVELGHKTLGTAGLRAGSQPIPGIYVADRFVSYSADEVIDRNGGRIPVGLDLDALAYGFGAAVVNELPRLSTYLTTSIGVPAATLSVNTERPEAALDRAGFGDLYVQPLKLGFRAERFEAVTGYGVYVPTADPVSRGGIGRGHTTHEFSLGGIVYFDANQKWHLSALASYDLNQRKADLDITRGDTIQIQGGAGATFLRMVDVGLAAYALWQVRDDRGSDVPAVLRGARDRAFGMGPEVGLVIPQVQGRLTARYEHDVAVRSRAYGQIFLFGLTVRVFGLDGT